MAIPLTKSEENLLTKDNVSMPLTKNDVSVLLNKSEENTSDSCWNWNTSTRSEEKFINQKWCVNAINQSDKNNMSIPLTKSEKIY